MFFFVRQEHSDFICQIIQFEEHAHVILGSPSWFRRLDLNNQHQKQNESEAVGILTVAAGAVLHRGGGVLSFSRSRNCHKPFCSPPARLPSSWLSALRLSCVRDPASPSSHPPCGLVSLCSRQTHLENMSSQALEQTPALPSPKTTASCIFS